MKYFLSIMVSIFSFGLHGACFQPVDGMNLWRMTAQVGSCVDVYSESILDTLAVIEETILDELDVILCSVGKVFPIVQANFTPTLTLSQPGYYKICENCTVLSGVLFISSDDVILDLGNYFLDGIFVIVGSGFKNITIKNGLMRNRNRFVNIGSSTQNITIQNMVFEDNIAGGSLFDISANGPINGLIIRDVTLYDAAPQNIVLTGTVANPITNVVLENIRCLSTNQTLAAIPGSQATIHLVHCQAVEMKNIVIADPYQGLDSIFLESCEGVRIDKVDITSSLASGGSAAGVNLDLCNNIVHENVSVFGTAFNIGFNTTSVSGSHNLVYNSCAATNINTSGFVVSFAFDLICNECIATGCVNGSGMDINLTQRATISDCTTNSNGISGLRMFNTLYIVIQGHKAITNGSSGIDCSGGVVFSITDCFLSQNADVGLNIVDALDIIIENIVTSVNGMQGISVTTSEQVVIKNVSALINDDEGIKCDTVDNIVISGCEAQKNGAAGFYIKGVNGGAIPTPSAPSGSGTVGRSACLVEGCSAFQNGATGFYFTNVGGARVSDCFSSYNINGSGFHLDSGSWNVHVTGCVATSNELSGFRTWDLALILASLYNNRFHDCHASQNGTSVIYIPGNDFTQNNTAGSLMIPPLAGATLAALAMGPDPFGLTPGDLSTYT